MCSYYMDWVFDLVRKNLAREEEITAKIWRALDDVQAELGTDSADNEENIPRNA